MKLNNQELNDITGGGFAIWGLVGAAFVFFAGVVDGYLRPLSCNK